MDSNKSDRRRFLKQTAALAGVAASAGLVARASRLQPQAPQQHVHNEPPRRGARYSLDHLTHYTPLQDYSGIITPAPVHFVQQHSSSFPNSMRTNIASPSTVWWTALEFLYGGSEATAFRIPGSFRRVSREQLSREP